MNRYEIDDRDREIIAERTAKFDLDQKPRVGDYVRFNDGALRRISETWGGTHLQTSGGGSYYLGNGYVSMSGSLCSGVAPETLTLTDERRLGSVWIFHHDWRGAGNGVDASIEFRVYACSEDAPR